MGRLTPEDVRPKILSSLIPADQNVFFAAEFLIQGERDSFLVFSSSVLMEYVSSKSLFPLGFISYRGLFDVRC